MTTPDLVFADRPIDLGPALEAAPGSLDRLTARLARAAEDSGDLDVSYRIVDSPVGRLLLAGTGTGLVRVAFESEGHDAVLDALAARFGPRILPAASRLDAAAAQLDEYFAGSRRAFDLPLDRSLASGYRRDVQEYLPHIGYGATLTYTQVAEATGRPRAVRAVGTACATNPLPIIVPCHRVLRSDGSLGGYLGGLAAKESLLRLERAA